MAKGYNHQTVKAFARIEQAIKKILSNGKRGKEKSDTPGTSVAQNLAQNLAQRRITKAAKCSASTLQKYWELQAKLKKSREALSSLGQYTDIPNIAPSIAPSIRILRIVKEIILTGRDLRIPGPDRPACLA